MRLFLEPCSLLRWSRQPPQAAFGEDLVLLGRLWTGSARAIKSANVPFYFPWGVLAATPCGLGAESVPGSLGAM